MVQSAPFRIVQITDLHLFAEVEQQLLGVPTAHSFEKLVKELASLNPSPDLFLLTGDLSQDGTVASYHRLQALLSPIGVPIYWLPGNHDCVEVMERSLRHPLFMPDKSFQIGGWKFLLLNSQDPGCVHGLLSDQTLTWLEQELEQAGGVPTLVSMHHPPFGVDSDWLDGSNLQNADELFAILDRYPQVQLVVFGHIHQAFQRQRYGVTYLGTPSTCIQFAPHSHDFALGEEAPGFRLLHLYEDGRWETQVQRFQFSALLDLAATGY
jgi:3',5'-cyclic-AMP phosphodiesterase